MSRHQSKSWSSDELAGWQRAAPTVDDDPAARIVLVGPELAFAGASELIPSWAADTPEQSWIEVQLEVTAAHEPPSLYRMGRWDDACEGSQRTSFAAQRTPVASVATDTLVITAPSVTVRPRIVLGGKPGADMPDLEALTLCVTSNAPPPSWQTEALPETALSVPLRLPQYAYVGGEGWCSPVALAMALAYWHEQTGDPRLAPFRDPACVPDLVVPMVNDPAWQGTGNWAFNTAFAASRGLTAYVTRLESLSQLARWITAGVPVIISLGWHEGELEGALVPSSGHLTLVRGFAHGRRVLTAEPASYEEVQVLRSYHADQFFTCWQQASGGAVYLIYPPSWPRPEPAPGDAWV